MMEYVTLALLVIIILLLCIMLLRSHLFAVDLSTVKLRVDVLEASVRNLQGMSTLPQATRAEVAIDIARALYPILQRFDDQDIALAEIKYSLHEMEQANAGHYSSSSFVDGSRAEEGPSTAE